MLVAVLQLVWLGELKKGAERSILLQWGVQGAADHKYTPIHMYEALHTVCSQSYTHVHIVYTCASTAGSSLHIWSGQTGFLHR